MDFAYFENQLLRFDDDATRLKKLSNQNSLSCPNCGQGVLFAISRLGKNHFRHKKNVVGEHGCDLYHPSFDINANVSNKIAPEPLDSYTELLGEEFEPYNFEFKIKQQTTYEHKPYFLFKINWGSITQGDSFSIFTLNSGLVNCSSNKGLFSGTFLISLKNRFLECNDNTPAKAENAIVGLNNFIDKHNFFILKPDGSVLLDDEYSTENIFSIYDCEANSIKAYDGSVEQLKELIEDGYKEVSPKVTIRISSPYATKVDSKSSSFTVRSFLNILIENTLLKTQPILLTSYFVSGQNETQKLYLKTGVNEFDFTNQNINMITIISSDKVFYIYKKSDNYPVLSEATNTLIKGNFPTYIIENYDKTYECKFENRRWIFQVKDDSSIPYPLVSRILTKKDWNDNVLGLHKRIKER